MLKILILYIKSKLPNFIYIKKTLIILKVTRLRKSLYLDLLIIQILNFLFKKRVIDLKKIYRKVDLSLKTLKTYFKTLKLKKKLNLNNFIFYF